MDDSASVASAAAAVGNGRVLWHAGQKLQTDWLLSCLFLLCDRLLDLSISSKKCPKFIIVIDINFIAILYRDRFNAQPFYSVSYLLAHSDAKWKQKKPKEMSSFLFSFLYTNLFIICKGPECRSVKNNLKPPSSVVQPPFVGFPVIQ